MERKILRFIKEDYLKRRHEETEFKFGNKSFNLPSVEVSIT